MPTPARPRRLRRLRAGGPSQIGRFAPSGWGTRGPANRERARASPKPRDASRKHAHASRKRAHAIPSDPHASPNPRDASLDAVDASLGRPHAIPERGCFARFFVVADFIATLFFASGFAFAVDTVGPAARLCARALGCPGPSSSTHSTVSSAIRATDSWTVAHTETSESSAAEWNRHFSIAHVSSAS